MNLGCTALDSEFRVRQIQNVTGTALGDRSDNIWSKDSFGASWSHCKLFKVNQSQQRRRVEELSLSGDIVNFWLSVSEGSCFEGRHVFLHVCILIISYGGFLRSMTSETSISFINLYHAGILRKQIVNIALAALNKHSISSLNKH